MAIDYKVWEFPSIQISKQLFHVPGAAIQGGFTSGGARISSPEPGGFSMLEIEPSMRVDEWNYPVASWIMSKTNGQIFRTRLAPTPQVAGAINSKTGVPWAAEGIYPESPWSNMQNWAGDAVSMYVAPALEGTNLLVVAMTSYGQLLRYGHVIGHGNSTYLIDEVSYDNNGNATLVVTPPLRRDVKAGDLAPLRPWFTGSIANGEEIRNTYDAVNAGAIQINKIVMNEVILP